MSSPTTETFDAPPDNVFMAVQAAAQQVAKKVEGVDPQNRTLYFNTGMSLWSWKGQNVSVSVTDAGGGRSQLQVGAQIDRRGANKLQVIDWGEGGRVAKKLIAKTREQLGAPAAGVSSPQ
jgi:hypothetical protein